ncbi:MAG: mechanosensitive ion channel family protein [Lentisphaerae bacterium]|nr:mechanosensitive ion channel family protein [Lentisphaerota bacterium]
MEAAASHLGISVDFGIKLGITLGYVLLLTVLRYLVCLLVVRRKRDDLARSYFARRYVNYGYGILLAIALAAVWVESFRSLATFAGLLTAGIAIAMHETISNVAGWLFILSRRPFKLGDRIQIGDLIGDVIDVRVFQFSVIEIGNWVDAEQSTGRIVHVPNGKVLREPLANYETGFEYLWNEIPVLVTFESDWKKTKGLLLEIVQRKAGELSEGIQQQIKLAAMQYLIYFKNLTPIVYTSVRDSGVLLTIRYIVKPRERRGSENDIWEAILEEFAKCDDIQLAYPTKRFYKSRDEKGAPDL